MLKVATAKEMQQIDKVTIEKYGITGTILMERAGLAVAEKINELFSEHRTKSPVFPCGNKEGGKNQEPRQLSTVIILCGGGNNGGDGLVIARILHNQGKDVKVFLSAKPVDLKGDAKINYNAAKKFGVNILPANKFFSHHASRITLNRMVQGITHHDIIVDALLGTGLSKEVKTPLSDVIKKVNKMSSPVISVDIPSGISSDTGQVMGCAVKAQYTVTFGLPKRGHLLYPGAEHAGELYVEEIGFPTPLIRSKKIKVDLVEREDALSLLPGRPQYSHKGTYGHVLLIAGSRGKTGAAFMAAKSCLRAGAGLVTIGVPETLMKIFQSRVTEEMVLPLPDKGNGTLSVKSLDEILEFLNKNANVLAVGPGISTDDEISKLVRRLVTESKAPVVIDADGINAIAGKSNILKKSKAPIILTPHPGEMARLLQGTRDEGQGTRDEGRGISREALRILVEKNRIETAILFAKKTKTYLVLKGVPTIIATPDENAFINSTGNPGMATAGTGDALTGMISAFLAQGLSPRNASILGVYMHGLVGDIAAEKKGEHSLVASDIINAIPAVFKSVGNHTLK